MLLDRGECHETPNAGDLGPVMPTTETTPRWYLVISVRIMHKLWVFVWSKEPMVCRGITTFVIELDSMVRG